jgi:phospholipid-binding lipoprotein MlaA
MSRFYRSIPALVLLLVLVGAGLARAAEPMDAGPDPFAAEEAQLQVADPLESVNRGVFWVNDKLYFYLFKPIARGLRVVPVGVRTHVRNVFTNLAFPIRFVNNLLQLKFGGAGLESYRFLLNSTIGLAGIFDPAGYIPELKSHDEDLGQTFGRWGIGHGFYLVLPILGPSSLRDGIGTAGDFFLDPINYINLTYLEQEGVKGFDRVNRLSIDRDTYEQIKHDALDPYLFVRDAYAQRRQAQVDQ